MEQKNAGQGGDRRANKTILVRTLVLMVVFGVIAFIPLVVKLYNLQIVQHEELEARALSQQTQDVEVSAKRGDILDSKGNVLATSATVYNVQLSPLELIQAQDTYAKQVAAAEEGNGKLPTTPEPTNEFVAENLAQILDMDKEDILTRLEKTWSQYEIIKSRIEPDEADIVREFIQENGLETSIYLPPTTKRYYPYGSLASQLIGWVNYKNDNKGAYGMEAVYEEALAGKTGRVVTAKNAKGTEMLSSYESYYDAVDGSDITLTIDATIQYYCEQVLQKGIEKFDVQDGGFAIAMDPNTGAILAWANSPNYDLNEPWTVSDPILEEYLESVKNDPSSNEEAYTKALGEMQNQQWRNKAINDTYEPGSTFKSIVLAAALEEGAITENDTFYCSGSVTVADNTIRCSKRTGHGSQTLTQAVENSCNPAFIAIGQKLGASKFYDYLEDFGFLEITGIDMQGELPTSNLIWSRDYFCSAEGISSLATASFGQRFNVTPIQLITAASAVVNGGHLMTPYVVQSVTDADGNVNQYTQPTEVRQVVSEATSERCRTILESVVANGTGKNAQVAGYRVGGKTGSSETSEVDHTIVSFLGFAPADDPQVVILLAYDNPKPVSAGSNYTSGGWYISGGIMAAQMASELTGNILNYMGIEKTYTTQADTIVPNVTGLSLADATQKLQDQNLNVRAVGDGDTITGQIPVQGASIPGESEVVVYMGTDVPTDLVDVPDISGMTYDAATQALSKVGLYLKATGVSNYGSSTRVSSQSIEAGTQVERGSIVVGQFVDSGGGSGWGL
ncbi:MAG: PASTA domain-containing protein [Oscillospiraceae bacterium]|nr:PASTA domain-containing protein [Oscillospiraceae bacterium]